MDLTASQYTGGGESGWTMYLEQSYVSKERNYDDKYYPYGEKGEEDDLSMMSDATSGPRYYEVDEDCYEENGHCFLSYSNELVKKKEKKKNQERCGRNYQQHSCLDDTASSTVQGFSEKNYGIYGDEASVQNALGFSQNFSETKFKGKSKSTLRDHLGFFQSSLSVKPAFEEKGNVMQRRNRS